jgi:hypothetical protein
MPQWKAGEKAEAIVYAVTAIGCVGTTAYFANKYPNIETAPVGVRVLFYGTAGLLWWSAGDAIYGAIKNHNAWLLKNNEYEANLHARVGNLRIGMTPAEFKAWRAAHKLPIDPRDVNVDVGSWGRHEQWCYDDGYFYFENGKLDSWQFTE